MNINLRYIYTKNMPLVINKKKIVLKFLYHELKVKVKLISVAKDNLL